MAIRTVSNTGGEYSSAATWVGGVKPILGKDSVAAFTLTSGPLLIDTDATPEVVLKGIDFRNYTNTLTLKNSSIIIDDRNTSGRASFVNLGTGEYTIIVKDDLDNILPNLTTAYFGGLLIQPGLTQNTTITSNGTPWNQYFEFNPSDLQQCILADNLTLNGIHWFPDYLNITFKNNRLILNGSNIIESDYDIESDTTFFTFPSYTFDQCTSIIEINSTHFYCGNFIFFGTQLIFNGTSFNIGQSGTFVIQGGTATTVNMNCSIIRSVNYTSNPGDPSYVYSNDVYISLYSPNLTFTATDINAVSIDGAGTYGTFTFNNLLCTNFELTFSGITTINANDINCSTQINLISTFALNFNVSNLTVDILSLTASILNIGAFITSDISDILILEQTLAASTLSIIFQDLNIITSVLITAPNTDITFSSITVPILTVNSSTSSTLNLGSTAGNITTLNISTPIADVYKNNCAITTSTITAATSVTITGGDNPIFDVLNTNTPLLIVDAANAMYEFTTINLTTNTIRTIELLSNMNISSIIGLQAHTTALTFVGAYDVTLKVISQLSQLNMVADQKYDITQNCFLHNCTLTSTTPGTRAKFNMVGTKDSGGANELMINVIATDIDSSLTPRGIHSYFGTVTNCLNWRNFDDGKFPQVCSTF